MVFGLELGTIRQLIQVPEGPATLRFELRFVDSGDVAFANLDVSLEGTLLAAIDSGSPTFERISIPIPAELIGFSARELVFSATCSNSGVEIQGCDRIDIDDVSVITGSETGGVASGMVAFALLAALAAARTRPLSRPPPAVDRPLPDAAKAPAATAR